MNQQSNCQIDSIDDTYTSYIVVVIRNQFILVHGSDTQ